MPEEANRVRIEVPCQAVTALVSTLTYRDANTAQHSSRVADLCVRAAAGLLDATESYVLEVAALLHDVGKLGIRDNVLLKPGKLTDDEFAVMKTHVDHGMDLTDRAGWLKDAQAVIGSHHEKFDGAGYPEGLKGEAIPLAARIFAITDVFDALTSQRPYKEAMSYGDTMQILDAGRGSHFDPSLLKSFNGIARPLFDTYSGMGGDKAKERLELMTEEYFKAHVADLLT